MRFRIVVAYDGQYFHGWQRQTDGKTVQNAIDDALTQMNAGSSLRCHGASRTDSGVSAEGQVAIFDYQGRLTVRDWKRGLNALTHHGICIRHVTTCPDDFHPRFHARGKHYRYLIVQGYSTPPRLVGRVLRRREHLDVEAMQAAAAVLVGKHDFSSFRASGCDARSPVRTMARIDVRRQQSAWEYPRNDDDGALITIDVFGNAFLKYMVRNIVGTLVEVGSGKRSPDEMEALLAARDRQLAGKTAAAKGLTLLSVFFDDEYDAALARHCAELGDAT